MQMQEMYKGFEIRWEEPPATGAGWMMNIAGSTEDLMRTLRHAQKGSHGSKVITGSSCDAGLAQARAFIDAMLG
jgi:hypothetical protein